MKNEPAKTIEHYTIDHLLCTHPDSSQFYQSTHNILKKPYTIRKIRHGLESKQILTSIEIRQYHTEKVYSKIKNQMELNKIVQGVGVPKCHKLIRTQRHFYLVYDEFPRLNLKQYIQQNVLTKHQKIELFIKIVQILKNIHSIGIVMMGIASETIRVDEDGSVFFTDLSQARFLQHDYLDKADQLPCSYEQILPDELIDFGRWGTFTDVYMVGKLFNKLVSCSSIDSSERFRRLLSLFSSMTQIQYQNRVTLQQVHQQLQKEINNQQHKMSNLTQIKIDHLMIPKMGDIHKRKLSIGCISNKSITCQSQRQFSTRNRSFEIQTLNVDVKIQKSDEYKENNNYLKPIGSNCQIKSFREVNRFILSPILQNTERRMTMKQIRLGKKLTDMSVKAVRSRNLAFFLLDLSQFVMKEWQVPEVAYLLIKKANLVIEQCLSKIQMEQSSDFEFKELYQLVFSEKVKIAIIQTKVRQVFIHQQVQQQFRRELLDEKSVDEEYMQRKVRQFGQKMMIEVQKDHQNKIPLRQLAQKLFYVYMVLKRIEKGSYQAFWDQKYNQKYAYLSQQRSINDQKIFGYDYLKRKVQHVLRQK